MSLLQSLFGKKKQPADLPADSPAFRASKERGPSCPRNAATSPFAYLKSHSTHQGTGYLCPEPKVLPMS